MWQCLWLQNWLEEAQSSWFHRFFFTGPVTAAVGVHGSCPWGQPCECSPGLSQGTEHRCGGWDGLLPLKLASTGSAARGIEKRNIHLNNLCPSNLCNFRNALDEDLCLCLIKQLVLVLVSFIKVLSRKIIFKFSAVENPQFVCTWFSIEILLLHVQLRDSLVLNSL